jgi:hypothetical protein
MVRVKGRYEQNRKHDSSLELSLASPSRRDIPRSDRDTLDAAINKSVSSDGN